MKENHSGNTLPAPLDDRTTTMRISGVTRAKLQEARAAYGRNGRLFRSLDDMIEAMCDETTLRLRTQEAIQ